MLKRRIVITGMGAVTPLGNHVNETWQNLVEGKSGIGPITVFDAKKFPCQIAGEVREFPFEQWIEQDPALSEAGRSTFFAMHAASEAYKAALLEPLAVDPRRFGIYFGAGDSGIDFEAFTKTIVSSLDKTGQNVIDKGNYLESAIKNMRALRELETQPFMTVTHLTRSFNIRGPVSNCLTACAASSQAIGEAFEWIKRGDADIIMAGGSHSMIYPLGICGFSLLTALSTRNDQPEKASRPFDKKRDGFVVSEGAGVVILEELSHALKRKAPILGEVVGYGSTADAYRMTDMDPEGKGATQSMRSALKKADLEVSDIDYISAHGTSTMINDMLETRVIKKAMGDRAKEIPISSIKSMLGHMIAAAGAVEVIASLLTIKEIIIPPTMNYEEADPNCDLDYVPNKARKTKVSNVLSNSFGFGGQNICLALKEFRE